MVRQWISDLDAQIEEVVADKGYCTNKVLSDLEFTEGRTYIAQPKQTRRRNWKKNPEEHVGDDTQSGPRHAQADRNRHGKELAGPTWPCR